MVFDDHAILIHSADPQSWPVVIIIFAHVVRPYVRIHFSNLAKQNKTTDNNGRYRRDCGSGRVDHWWSGYVFLVFFSRKKTMLVSAVPFRHWKLLRGWLITKHENKVVFLTCIAVTLKFHSFFWAWKRGLNLIEILHKAETVIYW